MHENKTVHVYVQMDAQTYFNGTQMVGCWAKWHLDECKWNKYQIFLGGTSYRCITEGDITKTRLFKYIENFTTKKLKVFR